MKAKCMLSENTPPRQKPGREWHKPRGTFLKCKSTTLM